MVWFAAFSKPLVSNLNFTSIFRRSFSIKIKMDFSIASSIGIQKYPRGSAKILQYGTAGFRDKATELTHVMYRMGVLAVLRSKLKNGSTIGVMITASHNPEEDNGVKLCDPDGKMLDMEWEALATTLVNTNDDNLSEYLRQIVTSNNIDCNVSSSVFLARDTRKSSPFLSNAAEDGVKSVEGNLKDYGLLTTPQLHFIVYCQNYPSYGEPSLEGYYKKLSNAFNVLRKENKGRSKKFIPELYVDGANGIGALKLKELLEHIGNLPIKIFNDGTNGILNFKCGSDFVKVNQKPPEGCELIPGKRYASFDGDADRLVYYYKDHKDLFHLLDGDKIAALLATYFKDLIETAGLDIVMRVIQTAYANGSSTDFIENLLHIPVICVPTGVKHLHHEAQKYDIGIYFEANGHGTVVFSEEAKRKIKELSDNVNADSIAKEAARKLLMSIDLINETVGDAISDMLMVEIILQNLDWDAEDWNSLYTDFPSRLLKVEVPDRQVVTNTDAGRICVTPIGLQDAINTAVSQYEKSRSFVRPSGTEDVVRVYAEARTQEEADKLAREVASLVGLFTDR